MSTLNAVGLSATSPGESLLTRSEPAATRVTPAVNTANPIAQDWAEIANVPAVAQIEPLQTANPTRFQVVLSDTIRQLHEAESQTKDPEMQAYLSSLAERFRLLQETSGPGLSIAATASK